MSSVNIFLEDLRSGTTVPAQLHDGITEKELDDWELKWLPALAGLVTRLQASGADPNTLPQTSHWDWQAKTRTVQGLLAFSTFAVVANNVNQGMMRVELNESCRLASQSGKPLVYIEYLEVAPWNWPSAVPQHFRGVGTALVSAAIDLSCDEGFEGRIGLHSLPQAEGFYRDVCGMSDLGKDPNYHDLTYFEMTAEQAANFNN
jgi:hypothetical protein